MKKHRLIFLIWLLFLLLLLALGVWLIHEGARVPEALRHSVWESGRPLLVPPAA